MKFDEIEIDAIVSALENNYINTPVYIESLINRLIEYRDSLDD